MTYPQEVRELLDVLLGGVRDALGDNLVGVYVRGSLAMGDFIPETSDVDVLAVTERPVDDAELGALATLHARVAALPHPFAKRMEMAYIDRVALKRYEPGQQHPTLGQGETLARTEHRDNWLLERWTVRKHGVTLLGPDPSTLIEPVGSDEIRAAVRTRLGDWTEWADQPDDPDWRSPRSHKAYVVETMCRALYTLAHGTMVSKPRAVAWALATLPEPWRGLVARSRSWRTDKTVDLSLVPEVMGFVHWTASDGEEAVLQQARRAG